MRTVTGVSIGSLLTKGGSRLFSASFSSDDRAMASRHWPLRSCLVSNAGRRQQGNQIPRPNSHCWRAWPFRSCLSRRPTSGHLPEEGRAASQASSSTSKSPPAGMSYLWRVPCPCQDRGGVVGAPDGSPIRLCAISLLTCTSRICSWQKGDKTR